MTCDYVSRGPFLRSHWMLILTNKIACYLRVWGLLELTRHKILLPITVTLALHLTLDELNAGKRKMMMGKRRLQI